MEDIKETGRIVPLLDYFSHIFNNCTLRDVAEWLNIPDALPDFLNNAFSVPTARMMYFCYRYNHVKFFVPFLSIQKVKMSVDIESQEIFDLVFEEVKIDISGDGLNWLRVKYREIGMAETPDEYLRKLPDIKRKNTETHITRCDIAFDLIDYNRAFLDDCVAYVQVLQEMGVSRIATGGVGGMKAEVHSGTDQKTLYLGTTQSDNMLRIYDKKLQYTDVRSGTWKKPCPYGDDVKSWIRIELQLRNKQAHSVLYGSSDLTFNEWAFTVFKFIYQRFAFMDKDYDLTYRSGGKVEKFWSALYEWDKLPSLIQNINCIQPVTPMRERVKNYVEEIAYTSNFSYIAVNGVSGFVDMLNEKRKSTIHDMHAVSDDISLHACMQNNHLLHKINECLKPGETINDLKGLRFDSETQSYFIKEDS